MFEVIVFDEQFSIDVKSGEGLEAIIEKFEPLIVKMTIEYQKYFDTIGYDDLKQEVYVLTIQGINGYDHTKNSKLSTFIYAHLKNKLITLVRAEHTKGQSASALSTKEQQGNDKQFFARREVLKLNSSRSTSSRSNDSTQLIKSLPDNNTIFYTKDDFQHVEFRLALNSILDRYHARIDSLTRKCIEDIYYEDMTIVDSLKDSLAKGRGKLSGWAMSMRLKNLAPILKDLNIKYTRNGSVSPKSPLNKVLYLQ